MANYIVKEKVFIPPYEGRGVRVKKGQFLKIVDVEGKQVGDFICFNEKHSSFHCPFPYAFAPKKSVITSNT